MKTSFYSSILRFFDSSIADAGNRQSGDKSKNRINRQIKKFSAAFTLMEVNLAILIMAGGILSIVGLYSLGFRENRQSREDVAGAAYADSVISPLILAASATNLKWSVFRRLESNPARGWRDYLDNKGLVVNNPAAKAKSVFSEFMGKVGAGSLNSWPSENTVGDLKNAGLVIIHNQDEAVIRIGFRASKTTGELLALPLYYTEVRFQGIQDE